MFPMVCVRCVRAGKPIPEFGAIATSFQDRLVVAISDGDGICQNHLLEEAKKARAKAREEDPDPEPKAWW